MVIAKIPDSCVALLTALEAQPPQETPARYKALAVKDPCLFRLFQGVHRCVSDPTAVWPIAFDDYRHVLQLPLDQPHVMSDTLRDVYARTIQTLQKGWQTPDPAHFSYYTDQRPKWRLLIKPPPNEESACSFINQLIVYVGLLTHVECQQGPDKYLHLWIQSSAWEHVVSRLGLAIISSS